MIDAQLLHSYALPCGGGLMATGVAACQEASERRPAATLREGALEEAQEAVQEVADAPLVAAVVVRQMLRSLSSPPSRIQTR
jgi:hypothetical protein